MMYRKFKEAIREYLKKTIPEIWWGDIPKVIGSVNPIIEFLKVPFCGWQEQVEKCANMMIVNYYGNDEQKKTMNDYLQK